MTVTPPPPGKTYQCRKCGRSFANEVDLKAHQCSGTRERESQVTDGIG